MSLLAYQLAIHLERLAGGEFEAFLEIVAGEKIVGARMTRGDHRDRDLDVAALDQLELGLLVFRAGDMSDARAGDFDRLFWGELQPALVGHALFFRDRNAEEISEDNNRLFRGRELRGRRRAETDVDLDGRPDGSLRQRGSAARERRQDRRRGDHSGASAHSSHAKSPNKIDPAARADGGEPLWPPFFDPGRYSGAGLG